MRNNKILRKKYLLLPLCFFFLLLHICMISVYAGQELFAWTVLYWMYFLVACVFFCWFIIDGTFLEALYCATCSCATQHIAFDVYMIYILAGGKNHIIEIVIYVTTYALCYFLIVRQMPSDKKYVVNKKAFLPIITIVLIVWGLSCIEILNPNTEDETSLYRICTVFSILFVSIMCFGFRSTKKKRWHSNRN